ncbi:type II secretion system F family protein [Agrococcus sp. KRD186]|uniref:type II secretion system F family protein n=1 Tax=Agrococcus sp. KRD186 TaxID=2729730 RepID=UPI0019D018AF|nr:type II secretion system F family protein [Agrococcus sp. KRD186]
MSIELVLACGFVAAASGIVGWVAAASINPTRAGSLANLRRGDAVVEAGDTRSAVSGVHSIAYSVTPQFLVSLVERLHASAGRPKNWPVSRLLTLKLVTVPIVALPIFLLVASRQSGVLVVLVGFVGAISYFLPELLLVSRSQEREQQIQVELADTLDQMTIAVEAGLGFDSAMTRVAAGGHGVLAQELTRTLQDIRMGVSRRRAFEDLAMRNHVSDLRQFVRAVLQADANGISIGDVLKTQAAEMRLKRRQRAEEKAQQVPVKVIFPLMLCILPVLILVVMAPAAMKLFDTFATVMG